MSCFTEKELMTEVLTNEKALSGLYHHAILEASTENIFKELENSFIREQRVAWSKN